MSVADLLPGRPVDTDLKARVETFLYDEAALLDERRFEDWLALFSETATYRIPIRRNVMGRMARFEMTGEDGVAHVDDDREGLAFRIARLRTGMAWNEQPPPRTRRIVGNVRIAHREANGEALNVVSNLICYFNHREIDTAVFACERRDTLSQVGVAGFTIEERLVLLDQNVVAMNLSVFL